MNITKLNFAETVPFMKKVLRQSDFVAIDFEMTGILASPLLRNSNLDSMQFRYWKIKENTKRFLPIQMGICGFSLADPNK